MPLTTSRQRVGPRVDASADLPSGADRVNRIAAARVTTVFRPNSIPKNHRKLTSLVILKRDSRGLLTPNALDPLGFFVRTLMTHRNRLTAVLLASLFVSLLAGPFGVALAQVDPAETAVSPELESLDSIEPIPTIVGEPQPYTVEPGPFVVRAFNTRTTDPTRDRRILLRVYRPGPPAERHGRLGRLAQNGQVEDPTWRSDEDSGSPLVIYSHGAAGTRHAGSYGAEHLAAWGYVVIAVQHQGSDRMALPESGGLRNLREAIWAMLEDPQQWRDRNADVSFVISEALAGRLNRVPALDPDRIGIMGHSYGAFTSMASAGMTLDFPDAPNQSLRDPRIRAAVAYSPQGPGQMGLESDAWDQIDIPVLLLTGTEDHGIQHATEEGFDWTWRCTGYEMMAQRVPDEHRPPAQAFMGVIQDGNHGTFGDVSQFDRQRAQRDPRHHDWINQVTLAFFDAHLRQNPAAAAWLAAEAIERVTQGAFQLESTTPAIPSDP